MVVRMGMKRFCAAAVLLVAVLQMGAQDKVLAPTPPMGWNSWDSYGLTVNEAQFRANMAVMATQLKEFGWQYVVVDEGWYLENPEHAAMPETLRYTMNSHGQYEPAPNRFPLRQFGNGFKPLSDACACERTEVRDSYYSRDSEEDCAGEYCGLAGRMFVRVCGGYDAIRVRGIRITLA